MTSQPLTTTWIDDAVAAREADLVRLRRRVHATPEPSGDERATTALVAELLHEAGLEPRICEHDVGAILDLDLGAPTTERRVALRTELDCVRVQDDKQVPYASTRPGLCHACGHDAHLARVLNATLIIDEVRRQFPSITFQRNLRVIFQPAEETSTGARSMISQGAIDDVEEILALHVDPFLDPGTIGLRKGPITSSCKTFTVRVRGRSGHSARPFEAIDPIPAATSIVSLMYQLCPRAIDARSPLALSVTSINAGLAHNAIPDEAVIAGTLRTTRVADTEIVQQRMESVVRGVAEAAGCDAELEFLHSNPPTNNDGDMIDVVEETAVEVLGAEAVHHVALPSLGAEDFGFYQELIRGAIIRLGTGPADGRTHRPLHSSLFDIDESALAVGTKLLVACGLRMAGGRTI